MSNYTVKLKQWNAKLSHGTFTKDNNRRKLENYLNEVNKLGFCKTVFLSWLVCIIKWNRGQTADYFKKEKQTLQSLETFSFKALQTWLIIIDNRFVSVYCHSKYSS